MPDSSGSPASYCVIGDPVAHSISPPIHRAVFEHLHINTAYEAVRVTPDSLAEFVKQSRESGRPGFNVTIPHKEMIMPLLDLIDRSAQNIGAVNTVFSNRGVLTGYNTDVPGCVTALKRAGFDSTGKTVILGAGGAARAGIESVARLGLSQCFIFDVLPKKAEALVSHFQPLHQMEIKSGDLDQNLEAHIQEADLIINASPVGMWPHTDATPLPFPEQIKKGCLVFDMVYTPLETRFMRETALAGAKTVSGLSMLVAQALEADAIFFDIKLPDGLFEPIYQIALNIMSEQNQ